MARLDRLAPVKEIAQIAAAIGREFSYRLLEAVAPIQGPALQSALGQLIAAELIHSRGSPPEATYVFKHALVQDTAYASLLRSRRQRIHADIARAMEELFTDQVEAAPAIIAHHYAEAGLPEPAARYWLKAAELALSRSAPTEADRYVDAGLALIPRLTDGPDRQSLELALQLARANALLQLKGFAAPETIAALTAAKQLLDAGVGTDLQRFSVLYGLCAANYMAAQMEPALALAREIVEVADRQDDTIYRPVGYRVLGTVQFFMGQNREALEKSATGRAIPRSRPAKIAQLSVRTRSWPRCPCLEGVDAAVPRPRRAGGAESASKCWPNSQVTTMPPLSLRAPSFPWCGRSLLFGDLEACERHSEELVAYCAERKVEQYRRMGAVAHACARALRKPTEENIAAVRAAIDAAHRSGARLLDSHFLSHLAEALLTAGDVGGAEATLQEALAFVEQSGERFWLADLHRLDGQIALKQPEPDPTRVEACFLRAIEIAREQEARLLELRAATDLARLWRDSGSPDDPRALLEPILAAIEGGETTRDVRNARALLAARVSPAFVAVRFA